MKKVLIILGVLVLVVVVAIVGLVAFGFSQIDALAKRLVEEGGTYATGVNTSVDGVDVGIGAGTLTMTALEIDNPEGYTSDHFLAMGSAFTSVDYKTVSKPAIRVPEVTLSGIDVNLDKTGGRANYQVILDNLKRFESGEPTQPKPKSGEGQKVVIDHLKIENISVSLVGVPGISQVAGDVSVKVPLVELKGVGGEEGMTFGELTNLVVKTVLSAVVSAGGGIIPGDILGELTGGLGQLSSISDMGVEVLGDLGGSIGDMGKQVMEGAQQQVDEAVKGVQGEAGKAVDDAAKKAKDTLGGILGGNKDEDDDGP